MHPVATDRLSTALPAQVLTMPSRVREFEDALEKAQRKLEALARRESAVEGLSLENSVAQFAKREFLDEIQKEMDLWRKIAEFYSKAIEAGRGEVPELMKLHAAVAGVTNGESAK